jgi:uncharacterized integral membrane protein
LATIILLVIVLALVAVFSMQNAAPVLVTFLFWKFEASLALVIFLSLLSGIIAGAITVSLLRRKPPAQKIKKDF